jgi:hypothetical protein
MTTMRWTAAGIACIAVSAACTLQQDSNPFGSGGSGYPVTSTASPVEEDTGDDESSSSGNADDAHADDAHADESSSDGGVDPSTTMPPTTDPTADPTMDPTGATTDPDPTGAMPGMGGLYDHCLQPEECGPGTTSCLQIVDMMNNPVAGFCTHEGCSNPGSDCSPPSSGDAQPFCLPVMIGNMMDAVCALDCGGGETCPDGTMCIQLEVGWVCA